jgi:hypothetical protein
MAEATPRMEARLIMRMVSINDVDGWIFMWVRVPATHNPAD